jgi:quercetin dioxygenase-like cupin family protein
MSAVTTKPQPLWFLANLATVKVEGAQTGGSWSMVELAGPRGDMPPLHVHVDEDEAFYVLEGRLTVFVGDEEIVLEPGDCAVAPKGIPHVYRVDSEQARWLGIASPSFGQFVTEVGEPAAQETLPPLPPAVDPARVAEIAAAHGVEVLGPPGTFPAAAAARPG